MQLAQQLRTQPELTVRTFDWRTALLGHYDVFHAHWPEILITGRSPLRAAAAQGRLALLLLRLSITGTPVVRTVHNLAPHEATSATGRRLLRMLDRRTAMRVHLNQVTPAGDTPHRTILHGDYRSWFASFDRAEPIPGRIAFIGLIRPYKQVDQLISAFTAAAVPGSTLRVAGAPSDPTLAHTLERLASADPRVSLELRHLSDAELVREITAAELVVLPYQEMHNSGGALAALSLDRPVLVPDNEVTRALAGEVGHRWVRTFTGGFGSAAIGDALATAASLRSAPHADQDEDQDQGPDLAGRDWAQVGPEHVAVYRAALSQHASGSVRRPRAWQ